MKAVCHLLKVLGVVFCFVVQIGMDVHADILQVLECHDKVVQNGIKTSTFAKEANALFGATNVDHFISNFGGNAPV